jgi:hypothetical protein
MVPGRLGEILDFALKLPDKVKTGMHYSVSRSRYACCFLPTDQQAGIQAITTPARTNMEVVNGALRSVRGPHVAKSKDLEKSLIQWQQSSHVKTFSPKLLSLESYQKLLEKEARKTNASLSDDIRIQILHKFSSGLSKLYSCKDAEFLSTTLSGASVC